MKSYANQVITRKKLEELFNENNPMKTIATIEYNDKIGKARKIKNTKEFKSGEIIVFWENREQTKLPEEFLLISISWELK
ncbi:MAG: hypothetical protein KAW92_00985 [Candidatus Cloacimonetes bacterium]|nr:hypothetical protein [Candidatus Cloacimonadota bacterium]